MNIRVYCNAAGCLDVANRQNLEMQYEEVERFVEDNKLCIIMKAKCCGHEITVWAD